MFRYDVNAKNKILHDMVHLTKVEYQKLFLMVVIYWISYPQAPLQLILQTYIMMKEWFVKELSTSCLATFMHAVTFWF